MNALPTHRPPHLPTAPDQEVRAIGNILLSLDFGPDQARAWLGRLRPELFVAHADAYAALYACAGEGGALTIPGFADALSGLAGIPYGDAAGRTAGYTDPYKAAGIEADFNMALEELETTFAKRQKIQAARRLEAEAWEGIGLEASGSSPAVPSLEFLRPSEVVAYEPPPGQVLVGQYHIVRGSVFVIGGAPGVGKSRASVALAIAGATRKSWFGHTVHRTFRTLIVQNENGRLRLKDEFSGLPAAELDAFVRISPPPVYGFALEQPDFCARLTAACEEFAPDIVLFDPWNAAAQDDKAGDYLATFKAIRAVIPGGDNGPAIGIVAHTRKPKSDERTNGRGLLNLLAGSYVLGSVPRSVFVLQPASDEPEDGRVVFTCCKNNDGPLGEATAWERRNGLFVPVRDFDWDTFRHGGAGREDRASVSEADVAAVLAHGSSHTLRKHAVNLLRERTGCSQSLAYNAFSLDGRFGRHLEESDGFLRWIP